MASISSMPKGELTGRVSSDRSRGGSGEGARGDRDANLRVKTCLISVGVSTVVGWDVQQGKTGTQRRFQRPGQQQRSVGGHSVDRVSVVLDSREDSELTQLATKQDETAEEKAADLQRHARSVEVQVYVPRNLISIPFLRFVPSSQEFRAISRDGRTGSAARELA
jgi:hypothetical protein